MPVLGSVGSSGSTRRRYGGWVTQAEVDAGARPGTTTNDAEKLAQLERDNRELCWSNAILRSASTSFAAERAALPICVTTPPARGTERQREVRPPQ